MHVLKPVLIIALLGASPHDGASADASRERAKLIVATKEAPPFAFRDSAGEWTGISIELWDEIASQLDIDYELTEHDLDEMLRGVELGEIDVAIAAISVTAEREKRVDLSHPYFTTGIGVAAAVRGNRSWWSVFRQIFSPATILILSVLIGGMILAGISFWYFERSGNEALFGQTKRKGVEQGVWWSTVILLGHKGVNPMSLKAKVLAGIGMVASTLAVSVLTGAIASVLTINQLDGQIADIGDLRHMRVSSVAGSTSADFLKRRRIGFQAYPTLDSALSAVADDRADLAVYDEAMLKHRVNSRFRDSIDVLSLTFAPQEYAIALTHESPHREAINQALIGFRDQPAWQDLLYDYLGE